MKKAKLIRITKSENELAWYHQLVTCTFRPAKYFDDGISVKIGESSERLIGRDDYEVIEWEEPPYAERQAEWVEKHDIRVGSRVRITRDVETGDSGSACVPSIGCVQKHDMVGKIGSVSRISTKGIWVDNDDKEGYAFPYTALEPIKDEYRPVQTFEEAVQFVGKVVRRKPLMYSVFTITGLSAGLFQIGNVTCNYESIFEEWTLLDGTPVGVKL